MKNYKILITALFLFVTVLAFAQNKEKREIQAFDKLDVFGNIQVEMIQGERETVDIFAKNVKISDINISVDERLLKIRMNSNLFDEDVVVKIKVTYREIREISSNAAADILVKDLVKTDKLFLSATSGARIKLNVDLNAIDIKVYQGAHIDISGKSAVQETFVNTGGILSGANFTSNEAYIKMNTGGKAEIIVNDLLEAGVNTGASLNYFGTPKKENIKTSLGGKINAWDKK
jgi:hypothetical protein